MSKWVLRVREEFSAAHYIPGLEGVHGHNYLVEVYVKVAELDERGMGPDFRQIRRDLQEVLPDHRLLNEVLENPTAEELARYIYRRLKPRQPGLFKVVVWEKWAYAAEYEEGPQ